MYFIEKGKDLEGKKVIFTNFAKFADEMIIVTEDKGIFVFDKDDDGIDVYNCIHARNVIFKNKHIREELNNLGVISEEEMQRFQNEEEEKRKARLELLNLQSQVEEYNTYLKLREKFEGILVPHKEKEE